MLYILQGKGISSWFWESHGHVTELLNAAPDKTMTCDHFILQHVSCS